MNFMVFDNKIYFINNLRVMRYSFFSFLLCVTTYLIFSFNISAQVGINTDTPSQALDINGKIEIGDDGTTPTEGTIRYNSTTKEFEGYNGDTWLSLSSEKSIRPIFHVIASSESANSINPIIAFDTKIIDTRDAVVIDPPNVYGYTIPEDGIYYITASVASRVEVVNIFLRKNGIGDPLAISSLSRHLNDAFRETIVLSTIAELKTGDYLSISVSANNPVIIYSNGTSLLTSFSGYKID